jgi:hypothetical protein
MLPEDFFLKLTALDCARHDKRTRTQFKPAKLNSRNCLNIAIAKANRQPRSRPITGLDDALCGFREDSFAQAQTLEAPASGC